MKIIILMLLPLLIFANTSTKTNKQKEIINKVKTIQTNNKIHQEKLIKIKKEKNKIIKSEEPINKNSKKLFDKILLLDLQYKSNLQNYIKEKCGKTDIKKYEQEIIKANEKIKDFKSTVITLTKKLSESTTENDLLTAKYKKVLLELQSLMENKNINITTNNLTNQNGKEKKVSNEKSVPNYLNSIKSFINSIQVLSINNFTIMNKKIKSVKLKINEKTRKFKIKDFFISPSNEKITIEKITNNCITLLYKQNKLNKEMEICKE